MSECVNVHDRSIFMLLGAGFETHNLGVSALACGALSGILGKDPTATVIIGDYSRTERQYTVQISGGAHHVALLAFRFSWRVWLPNNIFRLLFTAAGMRVLPSGLRERCIRRNRVLSTLSSVRIALAVNGGDSFSDIYGMRRLIYVLLPQFLLLLLGRPLVLLPQTYGPFRSSAARLLARNVLQRASVVATRDEQSIEEVKKLTRGNRQAESAHDMAFLMPPAEPDEEIAAAIRELRASPGTMVGLNISGLLWIGGYTRNNSFGLRCGYRELMEAVVAHLVEGLGCRVLLVPHVFGVHGESDVVAIREFRAQIPSHLAERTTFFDTQWDQHQVKWIIGQCELFIGSRMHACIAALSQTVPAVGLAYSGKFRGVFESVQSEHLAVDLRTMDVPDVVSRIAAVFRERDASKAHLARQVPHASATLSALFSRLILSKAEGGEPGLKLPKELCLSRP